MQSPSPEKTSPILTVSGLKKYFPVTTGFLKKSTGWIKAVDGVDFAIAPGKTLALVGESGCGKSTVGKLVLKLLQADAGTISFNGRDISSLTRNEMRPLRKEMQIIFQDPYGSLNPRMTIGQSIEEGIRNFSPSSRKTRREKIADLLSTVGLSADAARRYPHEFSGGQRQRVGIARALAVSPSLIVCDEPISALDVSIQAQIINLLKELQEKFSISYLFISHDLNVVGYLSDTVAVMYLGHIMEYGSTDDIFDNPRHPYTEALLAAVPQVTDRQSTPSAILTGDVPDPFEPPPGCKFQGRCPLAEETCRQNEISFHQLSPSHAVRCWKKKGQQVR